jgi:PAS domain S-box-containing protein
MVNELLTNHDAPYFWTAFIIPNLPGTDIMPSSISARDILEEAAKLREMVNAVDLAELASDAAFAVDGRSEIVVWNDAAQRLLGYAPEEVIGHHCADVLQAVLPGGEPLCVPDCEGVRCFRRHQPFASSSCVARHKDGSWVPMSLASVVMPKPARQSAPGSIVAVVLLRGDDDKHDRPSPERTLQIFTLGRFALATGGMGSRSRNGNASRPYRC